MKVLIIDDEDLIREVAKLSLEAGGYDVIMAGDGTEGVATAAAQRPDAILLDLQMPGLDGVQTFDALRAQDATKATPIVFLSAGAGGSKRAELLAKGAAGILEKPFDPMALPGDLGAIVGGP